MPKKSYMDKSNILTESYFKASKRLEEGFLSAIAKFFKKIPKLDTDTKKNAEKRLAGPVKKLNNEIDKLEKLNKKWLPDDYPPLPRFTIADFLTGK